MAIGLWINFAEGTQEQYEAINSHMGVEENPPDGLIFHAAGPIGGGWDVIDFWESREHFDRFQQERLGPAIEALGDQAPQGPPNIKEFPVANIIKG
ncbi:MAG TPA: hypothetical protein VF176_05620 [Solirubrobacterales bacterium]